MTMPATEEDDFTELVDYRGKRADLVGSPAHGRPGWLVMKAADSDASGLLDPEFVRDLIAKQDAPETTGRERVTMPNGVTLSGSPAAMAAFIHKAALRAAEAGPDDVAKAKYDAADLKRMAGNGQAMKDQSYPIADKEDLGKAIRAVGRGGADHDAIRRHVIARAKALGASSEIPDNWASDGSLKEKVTKDMSDMGPELDDGIDGLDPTVPLAAPEEDAPGDPTDPGSPAWEAIDAATACKWTSILARARVAIDLLSEREMLEAASGDSGDADKAWDLQDVCCAIDYAISVLAPFAVSEQSASDVGADAMAIGKAAAGLESVPLAAIEGLTAVAKSGRVLSAANEAHIREAAAALNTVLSSLPKAPQAPDDGQPVAKSKETTVDATQTAPEAAPGAGTVAKETAAPAGAAREVLKAALAGIYDQNGMLTGVVDPARIVQQVAKADGDGAKKAMTVVYNQSGGLIGIVDPDDITPVSNSDAAPDDAGDENAEPAPAADASDMTPQPPADAGTPADAVQDDGTVTKQEQDTDAYAVLKSAIAEAVRAGLGAQAPQEDVARQADVAGLTQKVEDMLTRIAKVEEMPAAPKVFTNGQVPPAHQLRGQDQGAAQQVDVAKAQEMRARFTASLDPAEQNVIAAEMRQGAATAYAAARAAAAR